VSNFKNTLSELRSEKGLSQRQAAAELGISQALLSHYENGAREPKLDFIVKVCDYYGVSADFLLGRTDNKHCGDLSMLSELLSTLDTLKSAETEIIEKIRDLSRN